MVRLAKVGVMAFAVLIMVYLIVTMMMSTQPYLTVSEVISGEYVGKRVLVLGRIVNGSIATVGDQLVFEMTDGGEVLEVRHQGPVNLSDGTEVVVEGTYMEKGYLKAQQILTRCPSKYESVQSSIFQDPVILYGSAAVVGLFTVLLAIEAKFRRRLGVHDLKLGD